MSLREDFVDPFLAESTTDVGQLRDALGSVSRFGGVEFVAIDAAERLDLVLEFVRRGGGSQWVLFNRSDESSHSGTLIRGEPVVDGAPGWIFGQTASGRLELFQISGGLRG